MAKKLRMRKCLVTKEVYSASELIRFVCAPDGQITPDVAAKLPGRGCWILAKRNVLEEAVKKKVFLRFGHQVIASSKKNDLDELDEEVVKGKITIKVRDDLVDQIESLLYKRCLDYLSLANRAGNILSGFEKVRAALKSGKTNVLLIACDGAENGRSKMCQGLDNLKVIDMFTRGDLSRAIGLENAVNLALLPGGIRTSLLQELSRYKHCRKTVIK
ncbi:MAG: DUF448 domain-containing protein [Emcibacteraceae bacterium]|nr:DUF448 domain-containing protein [Emcibacteraceae bacterium]